MGIHWTCCQCEQQVEDHQYDSDERICHDCMDKEYDDLDLSDKMVLDKHECSCGDKEINHAHEFPELGCICLTCNKNSSEFEGSVLVMYDEEVVHNLKKMIPLIKSMKTSFDHVRGDVEAREIMIETLKRAIELIK